MERKVYQEPAMLVVKLQHTEMLMQVSSNGEQRGRNGASMPQGVEAEEF